MPRDRPQITNSQCKLIGIAIFVFILVVLGSLTLYWCLEDEVESETSPTKFVELPDCQCPPFKLMNQEDIRKNSGGHYLRNLQTWDPIFEHNAEYPCWFNIECQAIPGVSSYYTTLFRNNGNPIYINRVVNNQSTSVNQPREIGDFKCAQHTDGSYQWHFHNYPVTDVGFACQADVDSCHCPAIKVDDESGAEFLRRFREAPEQCSQYSTYCAYDQYSHYEYFPFLYSKHAVINSGTDPHNTFYDDLICIKEDTNVFNWYYLNKKLENVTIKCGTSEEEFGEQGLVTCGAFSTINRIEMLAKYKQYRRSYISAKVDVYVGAEIGENSWSPGYTFNMTCEEGFIGVVFSDNHDPIELSGNEITCANNPVSNYSNMWIVNSVRVLNPAGGCFKKR